MKTLCSTCIAYYDTKESPKYCKFKKMKVTDSVDECEKYFYFEVIEQDETN